MELWSTSIDLAGGIYRYCRVKFGNSWLWGCKLVATSFSGSAGAVPVELSPAKCADHMNAIAVHCFQAFGTNWSLFSCCLPKEGMGDTG